MTRHDNFHHNFYDTSRQSERNLIFSVSLCIAYVAEFVIERQKFKSARKCQDNNLREFSPNFNHPRQNMTAIRAWRPLLTFADLWLHLPFFWSVSCTSGKRGGVSVNCQSERTGWAVKDQACLGGRGRTWMLIQGIVRPSRVPFGQRDRIPEHVAFGSAERSIADRKGSHSLLCTLNSVQTRCIVKGEAQKSPLFWRFSGGF